MFLLNWRNTETPNPTFSWSLITAVHFCDAAARCCAALGGFDASISSTEHQKEDVVTVPQWLLRGQSLGNVQKPSSGEHRGGNTEMKYEATWSRRLPLLAIRTPFAYQFAPSVCLSSRSFPHQRSCMKRKGDIRVCWLTVPTATWGLNRTERID